MVEPLRQPQAGPQLPNGGIATEAKGDHMGIQRFACEEALTLKLYQEKLHMYSQILRGDIL
jgi:hypothetical protein